MGNMTGKDIDRQRLIDELMTALNKLPKEEAVALVRMFARGRTTKGVCDGGTN